MHETGCETNSGNATSAVLISLLPPVEKDVLTNAEIRAILTKAAYEVGPHEYIEPIKAAAGIILNDILPRSPENGGD